MWLKHANACDIDLVHSRHFDLSLKKNTCVMEALIISLR